MRDSVADYQVLGPWGRSGSRYRCRPPDRLRRDGDVMVSELAVDAEGWQQLCDALIRLTSAEGPPVLEVLEVGPDLQTGGVFVATEAAPGGTLADATPRPGPSTAVEAVEQAARAAHALHEVGLAHGTIRPDTILLTDRGAVLDLPELDGPPGRIMRIGPWRELVCTDPELLAGEAPSRASDIWALGATLHLVLSDRPVFGGIEADEPVTALQRVMFTRPDPDPALPSPLRSLIRDCLAADPADRPPTALALAEQLAEYRAGTVRGIPERDGGTAEAGVVR